MNPEFGELDGLSTPRLRCPACGSPDQTVRYAQDHVPTRSAVVFGDRAAAGDVILGKIELVCCPGCGLISNRCFQPSTQHFDDGYEESQGYSPVFRGYAHDLAVRLSDRFDLRGKTILEIGCGKGGFLDGLCRYAGAKGIGIDPAIDPDRIEDQSHLTLVPECFAEGHRDLVQRADFVCCRHTLEHIYDTTPMLAMLREHLGDREIPFFVDVPSGTQVLEGGEFWDIYYEHCRYYTEVSFADTLRRAGFVVDRVGTEYAGQYLVAEARSGTARELPVGDPDARALLESGARSAVSKASGWERYLSACKPGQRVALWGSGSRAVGFLAGVREAADRIAGVVDINPYRAGKFMPGYRDPIMAPSGLGSAGINEVIVMNRVYREEIGDQLVELGVDAVVHVVDDPPVAR